MAVSGVRGGGGIESVNAGARPPSARPLANSGAKDIEDRVTLSPAARAPLLPEKFRGMVASAHADPKIAQQLAYSYANSDQAPIIDLSDVEAGTGPAKYAATGEPVTSESELRYKEMTTSLRAATASLYTREKANGTADADILEKLLSTIAAQPAEFRDITGFDH